jgi:phenylalanyl-tRNA synthetase alpha subunit
MKKTNFYIADKHYEKFLFIEKLNFDNAYNELKKVYSIIYSDEVIDYDGDEILTFEQKYHSAFNYKNQNKASNKQDGFAITDKVVIDCLIKDIENGLPNILSVNEASRVISKMKIDPEIIEDRYSVTERNRIDEFKDYLIQRKEELKIFEINLEKAEKELEKAELIIENLINDSAEYNNLELESLNISYFEKKIIKNKCNVYYENSEKTIPLRIIQSLQLNSYCLHLVFYINSALDILDKEAIANHTNKIVYSNSINELMKIRDELTKLESRRYFNEDGNSKKFLKRIKDLKSDIKFKYNHLDKNENSTNDNETSNVATSSNEQKEDSDQKRIWFKVGLLFAKGEMEQFYSIKKDNMLLFKDNYSAPKVGNEINQPTFVKYILGTINNYKTDKNIFNNKSKMEKIINFCKKNDIEVTPYFLSRFPTE